MARKAMKQADLEKKFQEHYSKAIMHQSPLACALISTAFLENALMTLLSKFFINSETAKGLFKGTLGDLAKCADMAYCLGFINTGMLKNIKKIGDVRNIFAHSPEFIDFNHPSVQEIVKTMKTPFSETSGLDFGEPAIDNPLSDPRKRFTYVVTVLYGIIFVTASGIEQRKEYGKDELWPS
jgi:hypothetical protein